MIIYLCKEDSLRLCMDGHSWHGWLFVPAWMVESPFYPCMLSLSDCLRFGWWFVSAWMRFCFVFRLDGWLLHFSCCMEESSSAAAVGLRGCCCSCFISLSACGLLSWFDFQISLSYLFIFLYYKFYQDVFLSCLLLCVRMEPWNMWFLS